MPANLPPQYYEEERKLKSARTPEEKVAILETLLSIIPKHKGTEKLQADLKSRLSKARAQAQSRPGGGRRGDDHHVEKEGAGQVALAGFANVGKSQLLASVTKATPLVADYPFSTMKALPGMARFENVWIQLVDLPPISWEVTDKWVANVLRNADALCLCLDLSDDPVAQVELLLEELQNKKIVALPREGGPTETPAGLFPKRVVLAGNKLDLPGSDRELQRLADAFGGWYPVVGVSAKERVGLEDFVKECFQVLNKIRVYTKAPSKKPDLENPFILPRGTQVIDLAGEIHKDFVSRFRAARIYCQDKYDGQRVGKDFILRDGDIIEFLV